MLGSADASTVDLSSPGAAARTIRGPGTSQYCGTSVAAAGDINGDGLADMLIGCPGLDSTLGALSATGRVYVVFGRTDPQDLDLANLGAAGFVVTGPTDTLNLGLPLLTSRPAVFGERLQSAPLGQGPQDVNDDGLADIVIGDSAAKRGGQNATGATYVIYGKADSQTVDATALGSAGYVIRGDVSDSMSGYSATIAGDLDGDTVDDIVIGAPGQTPTTGGRAYIVTGAPYDTNGTRTNADVDLGASAGRAVTLTSGQTADRFGVAVSGLGDTNLDGSPDVAIATSSGAYVLRTIPTTSRQVTADDGYRITGPTNEPNLLSTQVPAAPISAAGDLDGDERADLIIGYPDTTGARAYTVRSPETARTINVAALPGQRGAAITNGTQADAAGAAVAAHSYQGTTPVNENAQAIIGAPNASADSNRPNAGRAYVLSEPTPTGPGVDLPDPPTEAESTSTLRSAASAAAVSREPFRQNVPGLFNILVNDVPNTRWGTVRNDLQFLVIGNAATNQDFYVDDQRRTRTVVSGTDTRKLYLHGRLGGGVNRCGWVLGDNAPGEGEPFPGGQSPKPACARKRRLAPRAFAQLINCDACNDGSPTRLRRQVGGPLGDTRSDLPQRAPRDARGQVQSGRHHPHRHRRRDHQRQLALHHQGRRLRARPCQQSQPEHLWQQQVGVHRRKYLPHTGGQGGLCDDAEGRLPGPAPPGDGDDGAEFLDYNSQVAQTTLKRPMRGDWPRVCSHRKYNVPDGP